MPALVNRGTPIVSTNQYCPSLSPNPTNDGWNYIVGAWTGIDPQPIEWIVIRDLTTSPSQREDFTTTHDYPNKNYSINSLNQIRAQNGRIFYLLFANHFAYYDPITESVTEFGPFVETPPIVPTVSTIPFSATFDTAGVLYAATQESQHRPSCVVSVDTDTLDITVIGYVGTDALSYTTYGYYTAPDTGTATKGVWIAYGENPWQLWFITLAGVATKLYEVPATGHIGFLNIVNKGWIAQIHTKVGQPDDVYTQWWCLDGALYPYTAGVDPPGGLARNVTPASNPLISPPLMNTSGGIGVVGWRNTVSDPWTYVEFTPDESSPVSLEVMVTAPDGVMVGAQNYQGFVRYNASTHTGEWFGAQSGADVAQPLALYVPSLGAIFLSGYPNGVLLNYNPAAPWQTYPTQVNPANPGYFAPNGTTLAGIKYAGDPLPPTTLGSIGSLAWSPSAGTTGRLYCAGIRDRNGVGAGIGYWNRGGTSFAGTDAAPLDTVKPQGLVALDGLGRIVMSTKTLSGTGPAPLYVFDTSLALVATQNPLGSSIANIGQIFPTSNGNIICGAYIDAGGKLALYRWNVTTNSLTQSATTTYAGPIDAATINQADASVWLAIGDVILEINPDTLSVTEKQDTTTIAPLSTMAFYGSELYMSSGPTLWSTTFVTDSYSLDLGPGDFAIAGAAVDLEIGIENELLASAGSIEIRGRELSLTLSDNLMTAGSGTFEIRGREVTLAVGTDSGGWREIVYPPTFVIVDRVTLTYPENVIIVPPGRWPVT